MDSLSTTKNFYSLTPDQVLNGVEAAGFRTTGEYIQLNSYENRVFDVYLERDSSPLGNRLIAKFYRPQRWSERAILEEHAFLEELKSSGLPVIAPLTLNRNQTLMPFNGLFMAVFPKALGRIPQELGIEDFKSIGRTLARMHNIGAQRSAPHRPTLTVETYGWPAFDELQHWIAPEVAQRYNTAAESILNYLESELDPSGFFRIHGDCHKGNLLATDIPGEAREFFFIDFDDFCNGPAVQDFWMLLSGSESDTLDEQDAILTGYTDLRHFNEDDLKLIPALRGLRIIHYGAWIARRWDDPSFPQIFPDFQTYTYWAEEVEALERLAWSL